jgi:hypothetical protein
VARARLDSVALTPAMSALSATPIMNVRLLEGNVGFTMYFFRFTAYILEHTFIHHQKLLIPHPPSPKPNLSTPSPST